MTLSRPEWGKFAADSVVMHASRQAVRHIRTGGTMRRVAILAMLALIGIGSRAEALILTGGPSYTLPGGGSCTVSGVTSQTGGATLNCTGVNISGHSKVYWGLRNDLNVLGNTMTGVAPAAATSAVFRSFNTGANSITYSSTTTVADQIHGTQNVTSRLVLTLTSGAGSVVSVGGNPANGANGDIGHLFRITSTSFTIRADVQASDPFFALGQACPAVFDPSHAPAGTRDISKADVAFYWSDCGDSTVDGPDEQCDIGAGNGASDSCCTSNCQLRTASDVCRLGGGAPCDLTENCSGVSPLCPSDDAILNNGLVCRSGSGDLCDENETCNGVAGQGCPADDAPGKAGVVCRLSSAGDICDLNETCTGAPGANCPADDAPGKINMVCRPGSGDLCDPDERCTGFAGQGCPADIVANPSTVCRTGSGDSCDPNETCTAVPGQPCPANTIAPMGTQCRASAGVCDVAEACTGVGGQTCPANGFAANNTPCNVDNNVCTTDECNGSGACVLDSNLNCDDGNACSQDSCDPITGCESAGTPSASCVVASKATLKIKNKPAAQDASDNVKFIWKGGPALVSNMGDPTQTTRYELCIYDANGVQLTLGVPPGPGWTAVGPTSSPTGFKYKDSTAANQGVRVIKLKGSNLGKARAKVTAKGVNIPDEVTLDMPLAYPITAQLYASDGMCWGAEFTQAQTRSNDEQNYKAKTP